MLNLTSRQINSFLLLVQGITTIFCSIFVLVYLLGLRDLPENIVYHAEPIFRNTLSAFGVVSIVLIVVAIFLSIFVKTK